MCIISFSRLVRSFSNFHVFVYVCLSNSRLTTPTQRSERGKSVLVWREGENENVFLLPIKCFGKVCCYEYRSNWKVNILFRFLVVSFFISPICWWIFIRAKPTKNIVCHSRLNETKIPSFSFHFRLLLMFNVSVWQIRVFCVRRAAIAWYFVLWIRRNIE